MGNDLVSIQVPRELAQWWKQFQDQRWSGTLLTSFNAGDPQSWTPAPHCRRGMRVNIPE